MNFVIQSTFEKSKTTNQALLVAGLTFTVLFHKAGVGLNLALFSLLLIFYWWVRKRESFKPLKTRIIAVASVVSALSLAWYGTEGTVIWNILSLLTLSQFVLHPEGTILLAESKSIIRIILAPWQGFVSLLGTQEPKGNSSIQQRIGKLLTFIVLPLAFTLLFATFYQDLNPIFEKFYFQTLGNLDLGLLFTIILGLAVSSIMLLKALPERILQLDGFFADEFKEDSASKPYSPTEKQGGIVLFSLLNLTLFAFFVSDLFFLQDISQGLAEDYAHYVHRGVGMLILSIVMATALILYYFRNTESAQLSNRSALKVLAIVWVFLNIGIVCTTAGKNWFYVEEYTLSLKRVGIFVYLTLAIAGLGVTLAKLYQGKTNAFLIRRVYWVFFLVLTINNCMDWSNIITRFNIQRHVEHRQNLDWNYLLTLNERNIPYVDAWKGHIQFDNDQEKMNFYRRLKVEKSSLKDYSPEWREAHLAKLYAQSYYQP